ncbi:4-hydroxy-2-oxovalerate aldolase 4 [Pseudodesulfovibrio hydrargyri]|uniref:4-hydroxy-2-oxovalerate aldolase n=1 Tax=Pseudodesulfovibrio hydrargyri TaxID=2125990 RepID=A0A1J5MX33_9BACT|nr:4-hydroxy-2-oxovalerate aldolase [Pseudodesulfovibrio hydrargyri]OIQ50514.1 4-hydroxy-2-oxovalerate aldolase 4 [Pseudodesulfovibrio hydrargyri]
MQKSIKIIDTTLRDGSHAVSHSFTPEQVKAIAGGLDAAGVDLIEITHGDGLAGSSINYGFSEHPELELIRAASEVVKNAKLTVLLLPGIGTIEDLEMARDAGATAVRIATHCTEADIAIQHIRYAKEHGMFTVGFLMMVHMTSPEELAKQALVFEEAGADYINLADSAGHLLPNEVRARVKAVREAVKIPVGFHAHNNLGVAVANSLAAAEEGAQYLDATLRGLGAGAGNAQSEVLAAVLNRAGFETKADFNTLMDVAAEFVDPVMKRPQVIFNDAITIGYAGVYSSFLLHARNAAETYGVNAREILVELGKRRMVGGQEDMIIDVAHEIALQQGQTN